MWNFSWSVQLDISCEPGERVRYRVENEKRSSISPSKPGIILFLYHINTLTTRRSRLYSRVKKKTLSRTNSVWCISR